MLYCVKKVECTCLHRSSNRTFSEISSLDYCSEVWSCWALCSSIQVM